MGCSTSRLDDEEAVQLCKDRRRFIKEAVEHRIQFTSGHIAYIQALRRVSQALRHYVEGDEHREFFSDPYTTPPFTPIKKLTPEIVGLPLKSFSKNTIRSNPGSTRIVNYLRSGGNPPIAVEERPHSPETGTIESYPPMNYYGIDGFFSMQSPPGNPSFVTSPYHRSSFPPASPQNSQWDFFWNPFSSLDTYGYPTRDSLDQTMVDDDITGLRQVREEEGIPDLEEDEDDEEEETEETGKTENGEERAKVDMNCTNEAAAPDEHFESSRGTDTKHEVKGLQSQNTETVDVSETQNAVELDVNNEAPMVGESEAAEETPGFTVYVNRRPTSMTEVVKDLETQFMIACDSANEVSNMLEASRAQYSSTANELTAIKMLNPVALFRSASSRSSSSRFFQASSSSRDEGYDSSSDVSEDSCMFSGSHQSTLDRLYAWEKKLYEEVKSGERLRIAYEKKCVHLRNQDVKGEDATAMDKTRAAIRDLHTRIKVSIHTVESVSKRIETLRDEELQPQLLELIQRLAKMWRVMSECHRAQKRTIDDAKLLLAGTATKHADSSPKLAELSTLDPNRLARSAANLEAELRNWRNSFASWIASQRSYIRSLAGWVLRCSRSDTNPEKLQFSPRRSGGAPPIYGICIQWSRFLDSIRETTVIEGLDFFAAGVGSMYSQQLREDEGKRSKRFGVGFSPDTGVKMEMVEVVDREEEEMTAKKTAEVAVKVLCAGLSVSINSLTEFAVSSAEGCEELLKQWDKDTWEKVKVGE